jgi:hypothetical protein
VGEQRRKGRIGSRGTKPLLCSITLPLSLLPPAMMFLNTRGRVFWPQGRGEESPIGREEVSAQKLRPGATVRGKKVSAKLRTAGDALVI